MKQGFYKGATLFQQAKNKVTGRVITILSIRKDGSVILTNGDRLTPVEFEQSWEITKELRDVRIA